jgi:hypothetical protein
LTHSVIQREYANLGVNVITVKKAHADRQLGGTGAQRCYASSVRVCGGLAPQQRAAACGVEAPAQATALQRLILQQLPTSHESPAHCSCYRQVTANGPPTAACRSRDCCLCQHDSLAKCSCNCADATGRSGAKQL